MNPYKLHHPTTPPDKAYAVSTCLAPNQFKKSLPKQATVQNTISSLHAA